MADAPRSILSLSRLIRESPRLPEILLLHGELRTQHGRAAAIVACTLVESSLEGSLLSKMTTLTDAEIVNLFSREGPLSTFHGKILVAQALGIIGRSTKRDLETIKTVRNAFAHARRPIQFDTPEVKTVVDRIGFLERVDAEHFSGIDWPPKTTREKYTAACNAFSYYFLSSRLGHISDSENPLLE